MMTEKRYSVKDKWITDDYTDNLLNIDFNTIADAVLCCSLLNDEENKYMELADNLGKAINEKNKLRHENKKLKELLYDAESTVIMEYSSDIEKQLDELKDVLENGSIEDIKNFIRG